MPRRGRLAVRELALDPDIDESPLEHFADLEAQLRNRIDLSLEFRVSHAGSIVYPCMDQSLRWLPDAEGTVWAALGTAKQAGLPVPAGFIVLPSTREACIRSLYEELKIREKTHFVALRGISHAVLNVVGPDQVIHTLRRFWMESLESPVLVQRMVPAIWSGKAQWHRRNLRIKANEGMMSLDPDTYLVNSISGKCARRTLEAKQRKMIRHVDGTSKVVERAGERTPMPAEHLKKVADLAVRAGKDISWAIDDNERVWLISVSSNDD